MKTRLAIAIVALGSFALLAGTASAQAAAIPSPFHAGQWGIEAYASLYGGGGVTRFFTPRTALVLDVTADHLEMEADDLANANLTKTTASTVDISLGVRHHTMVAPKIASTIGVGIRGTTIQRRDEYGNVPASSAYRATYAGAFVEIGGQYMIADHFAVGIAYSLNGRHATNNGSDQHGFEFSTSFLPLRATLYF